MTEIVVLFSVSRVYLLRCGMNKKIHSTKALKLEDIHLVWLTQTAEASYYLFAELWEIIFA